MSEVFSTLVEQANSLIMKLQADVKEAFHGELEKLFEKCPDLGMLVWTGYTPHFNDGDECVYRLNGPGTYIKRWGEVLGDDEDSVESLREYLEMMDFPTEVDGCYYRSPVWECASYVTMLEEVEEGGFLNDYYRRHLPPQQAIVDAFFLATQEVQEKCFPPGFVAGAINHDGKIYFDVKEYTGHKTVKIYRGANGEVITSQEEYEHD